MIEKIGLGSNFKIDINNRVEDQNLKNKSEKRKKYQKSYLSF